jgi:hypothetical protein
LSDITISGKDHERRKSNRIAIRKRCWITGQKTAFYTQVDNISQGGIAVSGHPPFKEGEEVSIRLMSARKRNEMVAVSRVVWAQQPNDPGPTGMGAEFVQITSGGKILEDLLYSK